MTPEQIKQAHSLIEEKELLEQISINVGRHDLSSITLKFHSRGDMPIPEPLMKLIRGSIEQALAREITRCRMRLDTNYDVREVA